MNFYLKNAIVLLSLTCFLTGCIDKQIPSDQIQPDQLAKILKDLLVLEQMAKVEPFSTLKVQERDSLFAAAYQSILNKHQCKPDNFKAAMDFYQMHPKFMESVQEQLINLLMEEKYIITSPALDSSFMGYPQRPVR